MTSVQFDTYVDNDGKEIIVIHDDDDDDKPTELNNEDEEEEKEDKMAYNSIEFFFTLRNAQPVSFLSFFFLYIKLTIFF